MSIVPSSWPMAGVAELSPLRVTSVSWISLLFPTGSLIFAPVALDGSMILFSMLALSVFHPGRLLDKQTIVEENKNGSVTEA